MSNTSSTLPSPVVLATPPEPPPAPLSQDPLWVAARDLYVDAGLSAPVVAERTGVPERSLRRRAAAEGWGQLRRVRQHERYEARRGASPAPLAPLYPALPAFPEEADPGAFSEQYALEVDALLARPDPANLSRFAYRRAADLAAQGRPAEAAQWLKLIGTVRHASEEQDKNEARRYYGGRGVGYDRGAYVD